MRPALCHLAAVLAALAAVALTTGCDLDEASDVDASIVHPGHPCPDSALPPTAASLWDTHFATGEPVPLALLVPFPADVTAIVTQASDGSTHHGDARWAWDFAVPDGTQVTAAASGIVVYVEDGSERHGSGHVYRQDANFIIIDHGGGLFSNYVHLAYGSALVQPGDAVAAGDPLATTGASGQTTGPHLHFQVDNIWARTVPIRFVGPLGQRCDMLPTVSETVHGGAAMTGMMVSSHRLSDMPANAFAATGVYQLGGLPARLFERDRTYTVSGEATAAARDVYLLVLPVDGGDAVAHARFAVSDGRFSGDISLSGLEPGSYGLGLLAVASGHAVFIVRSVRISVIDAH